MEVFDDWQIMGEQSQLQAQAEYAKLKTGQALSVNGNDYSASIFEKIAYLWQLLFVLKKHNNNNDIILILNNIEKQIKEQIGVLKVIFEQSTQAMQTESVDTKIFCNNLKLSVSTCFEIINLLVKQQAENLNIDIDKKISVVIENFCDICQQYVSLFGECKYRVFVKRYKK